MKELDVEIRKTSDDREKAALNRTKTILKDSMGQLIKLAKSDCKSGVKLLNAALDAIAATADAAGRIDRRRIPPIIKTSSGRRAGKVSGKIRAEKAQTDWQKTALALAREVLKKNPNPSMAAVAVNVERKWNGALPVSLRWLTKFLREQKNAGALEK